MAFQNRRRRLFAPLEQPYATKTNDMNVAFLSAFSALAGSIVGGLTSGVTNWLTLRSQERAGQFAREMSRRDDLYKDFIVAASKVYGDALISNEPHLQELVTLYAMISRMRLLSSPQTVARAENVVRATIDTSSHRIKRSVSCMNLYRAARISIR